MGDDLNGIGVRDGAVRGGREMGGKKYISLKMSPETSTFIIP